MTLNKTDPSVITGVPTWGPDFCNLFAKKLHHPVLFPAIFTIIRGRLRYLPGLLHRVIDLKH